LFAQLFNELVEFHTEATTTGTFKLPGIKETGDAAAAAATTTTTWQGMTFPCSPAVAKQKLRRCSSVSKRDTTSWTEGRKPSTADRVPTPSSEKASTSPKR
jgi:hypothetical protein